jgi:branched-chain amino acid transport system permease protein
LTFKAIGRAAVVALLATFAVTGDEPAPAHRQKFLIGSAIALTGKYAREGTFVKKGYDFWSGKVNAQGGIQVGGKRYPVEIIYYDDRSDPQTSTRLVEKLITEDKVDLVFGPYSSDCVGPSSTITEKYKVPMMESGGGATPLFRRGFKFLFCTLMLGEDQAEAPMKLLSRQIPRPKTIAIIAPKTPFTLSSAEGYRKYAAKYGFEVIHYETYPADMADITPILRKVKAKNPDALFVGSHTVLAMTAVKRSKEIDFDPKYTYFSMGTNTPEFIKELGKDADYAMGYCYVRRSTPYSDPFLGTTRQFFDDFYKEYQVYPDDGTVTNAVAGGMAFMAAIRNAGVTPPLTEDKRIKVRDELAKLHIVTAAGAVNFDPTGHNRDIAITVTQVQKGKVVSVFPEEWAEGHLMPLTPRFGTRGSLPMMLQVLLDGILMGGIYASCAVGFSLIFGVLRIINIVHGEFIMLGAFTTYWLHSLFGVDPFVSLPVSFCLLFVFGYLLERFVINRVIEAPEVMSLLLTFGLSLIISNLALIAWKGDYRLVNPSYAAVNLRISSLTIPYIRLATFLFALVAIAGLYLFLQKTDTGRAIRATAQNKDGARLQGVSPAAIYAVTFGLGAGVTAIAGSLLSMSFSIFPSMGGDYLLFAFFIVVVGGLGHLPGTLAGGLLLGILQSLSTNVFGAGLTYILIFAVLYLVLIVRPGGIFGKGLVS